MPTLWARTVSYDSVQVGDELPILVKYESRETIGLYATHASPGSDAEADMQGGSGATTAAPAATVAYVAELLEKSFPLTCLLSPGSDLEVEITRPIGLDETVSFTGHVTGKQEEAGTGLVECEMAGTNHLGQTVARARATIAFPVSGLARGEDP